MSTLTVISGPAAGQSLEVEGDVVIGREGVDFVIDDPEISRRHAVVRRTDDGIVVEDLGSRNGTWVNGRRITGPTAIADGGTVRLGTSEIKVNAATSELTRVHAAPAATAEVVQASAPAEGTPLRQDPLAKVLPGILALLVAVVVALVAVAETGGSKKVRSLSSNLDMTVVHQLANEVLFAGVQKGAPTKDGTATMDAAIRTTKPGPLTAPTAVAGKIISAFDDGSMTSVVQLTATPQADGSTTYTGDGTVTGGTGAYDGASGTFSVNGKQPTMSGNVRLDLRGSVKY